jgi:hypothetical protein
MTPINRNSSSSQVNSQNESPSTDETDESEQPKKKEQKRKKVTYEDRVEQNQEREGPSMLRMRSTDPPIPKLPAYIVPRSVAQQFNDFCRKIYSSEADAVRMRITNANNAKTQRFLFYHQSNRKKFKRGGKRKRAGEVIEEETSFDIDDFKLVEAYCTIRIKWYRYH